MTNEEREELIEKMARAAISSYSGQSARWDKINGMTREAYLAEARAALEIAEPVIREQADAALRDENEMLKKSLKSILIGSLPSGPVDVENRCRFADPVWEVKARVAIREGGGND